jgi:hypothetical protein
MRTFTASDIAKRIQRPGEKLQAAVDRLRNWAKEGLIKPVGSLHPGTGRKKQYPESAATRAMILQALADATGGPAVFLSGIIDQVEEKFAEARRTPGSVFMISRRRETEQFAVHVYMAKDLGKVVLTSSSGVAHIVLNPARFLEPTSG